MRKLWQSSAYRMAIYCLALGLSVLFLQASHLLILPMVVLWGAVLLLALGGILKTVHFFSEERR